MRPKNGSKRKANSLKVGFGSNYKSLRSKIQKIDEDYKVFFNIDPNIKKSEEENYVENKNNEDDLIIDLLEMIIQNSIEWNSVEKRNLSVLIFAILRKFNIPRFISDPFLKEINCYSGETCLDWYSKYMNNDYSGMFKDGRIGLKHCELYEIYPELEKAAYLFAFNDTYKKTANFDIKSLAKFITDEYLRLSEDYSLQPSELIRSIASCRLDLIRWGCLNKENIQRTYDEGHERDDVVEYRTSFCNDYIENKSLYYTVLEDAEHEKILNEKLQKQVKKDLETLNQNFENIELNWKIPIRKETSKNTKEMSRRILICHDESTFRSGQMCRKRWVFGNRFPFYNKGRGRSIMVSDFIVQHPTCPFFELSQVEWVKAIQKYPELNQDKSKYLDRSATRLIELNGVNYFDKETILEQFERLFKLLEFKEEFFYHDIEILVDNATTHTAKLYNISQFRKGFLIFISKKNIYCKK